MTPVVIFGTTDYSRLVARHFGRSADHELLGFTADRPVLREFDQYPVFDFAKLREVLDAEISVFSTVGYASMRARAEVMARIREAGFSSTRLVCESAYVGESVTLGDNTIVMPGCVIEDGCRLGDNNTVWSSTTICHDAVVGHHNFIAANAVIGGGAHIGSLCFFGFSSVVLQKLSIADETLLAAGSVLTRDTEPCGDYRGTPATRHQSHAKHGIRIV